MYTSVNEVFPGWRASSCTEGLLACRYGDLYLVLDALGDYFNQQWLDIKARVGLARTRTSISIPRELDTMSCLSYKCKVADVPLQATGRVSLHAQNLVKV